MFAKIIIRPLYLLHIPEDASPLRKLLYLALLVVLSFGVFSFFGFLLAKPLFGVDAFAMKNLEFTEENMAFYKFLQVFNSLGMFVIPPILYFYFQKKSPLIELKANKNASTNHYLWAFLCMLFSLPVINFLVEWNGNLQLPEIFEGVENWMKEAEQNAEQITKAFLNMPHFSDYLINIVVMALIPALGEELLFRATIQKELTKQFSGNIHLGIWITAALFSAIHLQFFGFFPRMILGAVFGYFLVYSGSIWVPILAHFLNNAFAVTVAYTLQDTPELEEIEHIGESGNLFFLAIIGSIVVIFLLRKFADTKFKEEI